MASCTSMFSTDPDELAGIIRPVDGTVMVERRGAFQAWSQRLDLRHLWMQHVGETLPRIWEAGAPTRRLALWFQTQPGPDITFQGGGVGETGIGVCPVGHPIWHRTTGPAQWGSMSLPLDTWESLATVAECDPVRASSGMILTPAASAMARLRRMHRSVSRLAAAAPDLFDTAETAHAIEQSMIQAMLECLQPAHRSGLAVPLHRHRRIMEQLREVLESHANAPLYMPELCVRLGVPDRTLRTICHDYLGISPKKYLHLRRMHLVRRALLGDHGRRATVTEIATRFGFWELGRFSVEYKALFGESPSSTLRRAH